MTPSIRAAGDASFRSPATITPHRKSELQLVDTPDLPAPGDRALIRTGEGLPGVITHVRDNAGSLDAPNYRSTYYLHTRRGTEPHTRGGIEEVLKDATTWVPSEEEEAHLQQVRDFAKTYPEALQSITVLYHRGSASEVVTR